MYLTPTHVYKNNYIYVYVYRDSLYTFPLRIYLVI